MARRLSALLTLAVASGLLLAAPAAGASYSTKVIVSLKTPAFHGKVKSSKSSCTTNRTVRLFRKKAGPDRLLGTSKSNAKGKWSIRIKLKPGSYYAKAPAKGGCRADKSNVLTI